MIQVYRLHSSRYPAESGRGAALYGGRWNEQGTEAIYTSGTRSLAILEILVHYDVLPKDFVLTPIQISDDISTSQLDLTGIPAGWDRPVPTLAAQRLGSSMIRSAAVLTVPSAIVPQEYNYILNPARADFGLFRFLKVEPFRFDPRLKNIV